MVFCSPVVRLIKGYRWLYGTRSGVYVFAASHLCKRIQRIGDDNDGGSIQWVHTHCILSTVSTY